jgi:hypothetical protein
MQDCTRTSGSEDSAYAEVRLACSGALHHSPYTSISQQRCQHCHRSCHHHILPLLLLNKQQLQVAACILVWLQFRHASLQIPQLQLD